MSHFSVLVVGDVDYNMAPFHEFECDGVDDEFIQTIDVTKSLKEDYEKALLKQKMNPEEKYGFKGSTFREFLTEYHGYHVAESEEAIDLEDAHKFGYALLVPGTEDDFQVFDRTNPNKFYDYYGTGYRGLKLKKPTTMKNYRTGEEEETMYTNSALKKEVDFEGAWAEKEQKARELHRKVVSLLGYAPTLKHTWESLIPKFSPRDGSEPVMSKEDAVAIYEAQKTVRDWDNLFKEKKLTHEDVGIFTQVDEFCVSEDKYVENQHIHALTFGYVINREYHSNGDMGWWAIVIDEKDPNAWDKEYKEFIESLPDDAELTILDCHI